MTLAFWIAWTVFLIGTIGCNSKCSDQWWKVWATVTSGALTTLFTLFIMVNV